MRSGRVRVGFVAGALLALSATGVDAQREPVRLLLPDSRELAGQTYAIEYVQEVRLESAGRTMIVREARVRFRFTEGGPAGGGRTSTVVVLDTIRAAVSSPHGREVMDLRRLAGTRMQAEYARAGGAPTWTGDVPVIEFGMFGQPLPVSVLIDHVFPALRDRPVKTGNLWEHAGQRRQLDGQYLTTGAVTTRYSLDGYESRHGVQLARVSFASGAPDMTGMFLVGVEDGVIHAVTLEDRVGGSWNFGGTAMPFEQTTRVTATRIGTGH